MKTTTGIQLTRAAQERARAYEALRENLNPASIAKALLLAKDAGHEEGKREAQRVLREALGLKMRGDYLEEKPNAHAT